MPRRSHTLILADAPFRHASLVVGPLAARRAHHPDERITVAAPRGVGDLLVHFGLADEVWEVGGTSGQTGPAVELFRAGRLVLRASRSRYDRVIDLFPKAQTRIAGMIAVKEKAFAEAAKYLDRLLARGAGATAPPMAERIARELGEEPEPECEFGIGPEEDAWVERALAATGYRGASPVVLLHSSGLWDPHQMAEVGQRLRSSFDAWIATVDAPRETENARDLAGALGGNVLGITAPSAARFVALLARSSLLVTDDMGAAALAGLLHVPAVFVAAGAVDRLGPTRGRHVVEVTDEPDGATRVTDAAGALMTRSRTSSLFEAP